MKLIQPELKLMIFHFCQVASTNKRSSCVLSATLLLAFYWLQNMALEITKCLNNTIYPTLNMIHCTTPMPPKLKGYLCYKTIFVIK